MTLAFNQKKPKSVYHFLLRLATYYNWEKNAQYYLKLMNQVLLFKNPSGTLSIDQPP